MLPNGCEKAQEELKQADNTKVKIIIEEEVAAAGSQEAFKSEAVWDYILSKEPSFADKVLSFFRKSAREYSSIQGLSVQARKFVRQYKALFESLSERNQGNNALSIALDGSVHVTGDNDEEAPATTNTDVDTDTRYAIKYPNFSDADISSNMDDIADMEAVATIDASKLEKTGKSPMDTFNEYFNSLGNNIASETFGDIALPKSSAKSEIRHGITAEKIASIEAIPAVIEQGKVIFHKAKEGGVERIVVCAPIKIGDADYYMGVMLQRDARYQRLYLHNVVSVAIEREATSSSKDNLVTTGALEDGNHLSITSIIQKAINVKAGKQKAAKKPSRRQASDVNTTVRHSLPDGKRVVVKKDLDIFNGVALEDYWKVAKEYMEEHYRDLDVDDVMFNTRSKREYINSRYTNALYNNDEKLYKAKMQAITELDNMIKAGEYIGHEEADHPKGFNRNGYDRYAVNFSINNENFSGELLIAISEYDERAFYDIVNIKQEAKIPSDARFSLKDDIESASNSVLDTDEKLGYTRLKNDKAGKVNEDGKNSEILAERGVSTSHRGRDSVWKQGYDPEDVYRRLASSQNDQSRSGKPRPGSSGWLGDTRGNQSTVLRFRKSLLRNLRGRQLSGKDTVGRDIAPFIEEKFSETVLKDENGDLLSLYHWTDANFREFAKGDVGFHLGTLNASHKRYRTIAQKRYVEKSFYKECYVNITNPVVIDFDPITWDVFPITHKLNERGIITDEELLKLKGLKGYLRTEYDSPAAIELRRMLAEKGYDGIIYSNYSEGDLSVIAFDPSQIHTVAENGIDINETSKTISNEVRYSLPDDWEADLIDELFGNEEQSSQSKKNASEPVIKTGTVTSGYYAKTVANLSKENKYNKRFAEKYADEIIDDTAGRGIFKSLPVKVRDDIIAQLWEGLNTIDNPEARSAFAHDMAEYAMAKILSESKVKAVVDNDFIQQFNYLSDYIHKIRFT